LRKTIIETEQKEQKEQKETSEAENVAQAARKNLRSTKVESNDLRK